MSDRITVSLIPIFLNPTLINLEISFLFKVLFSRSNESPCGSISDNKTGGWYAYRSSKTALNQIIKNFSIELRRTNPNAIIIGLQPGTVDSNLSEPFKRNVKEGNLFTPDYSVSMLKKIINEASPCNSGSLIAWDGEEIKP